MIRADKLGHALYALNGLLVLARHMAYSGRPGGEIADVLDVAEYLPRLMADGGDKTDEFHRQLTWLAEKYAEFSIVVQRFEGPLPERW